MSKYIFVNVPAHGHVNPTLAVAQALVQRGESVSYYLTESFRPAIEATGATFHSYQSALGSLKMPPMAANSSLPMNASMMPFRMADEGQHVLPQIIEDIRAEKPDVIIYDMMCIWGKILARALHIPAIQFRPSYASNRHFSLRNIGSSTNSFKFPTEAFSQNSPANKKLAELCQQYDVEPFGFQEMFMGAEPLNIVFIPKEFQPHGETFDNSFVFVGPAIQPQLRHSDFPLEKLAGKTTLYISLGTVFNNQIEFFNMCFAAFKDAPWQVILSYGNNIDPTALNEVPENFLVAPYIPQLEVLSKSSVFITHGGMNSTMESLYYGVPMVAVPQMIEQAITARHIQELGLGVELQRDNVSSETLREAVEHILADSSYQQRVHQMQQKIHSSGGAARATEAIIEFTHTH